MIFSNISKENKYESHDDIFEVNSCKKPFDLNSKMLHEKKILKNLKPICDLIWWLSPQTISDRCAAAIKIAQEVDSPMEPSVKAYNLLEQAAEYQQMLELRAGALTQAESFFQMAQSANYQLDQLEMQVRNVDPVKNAQNAKLVLESTYKTLESVMVNVNERGNGLIQGKVTVHLI